MLVKSAERMRLAEGHACWLLQGVPERSFGVYCCCVLQALVFYIPRLFWLMKSNAALVADDYFVNRSVCTYDYLRLKFWHSSY